MLVDDFTSPCHAGADDRVDTETRPQPPPCTTPDPQDAAHRRRRIQLALGAVGLLIAAAVVLVVISRHRARRRASLLAVVVPTAPDPRPRLVRAVLSAIDQRRRPPRVTAPPPGFAETLRALRRPPAPRVLPFIAVKRTNPRVGDTFGHWWIEIDGTESYGFWPDRCPVRLRDFLFGTRGTVNGLGGSCAGGTAMTDPHHFGPAQHTFHPTLMSRRSDRRVRADIRRFAQGFSGEWRWSTKPTSNDCRSFQLQVFRTVGLDEGPLHLHTRGRGCPFMALLRSRRHIRHFASAPLV